MNRVDKCEKVNASYMVIIIHHTHPSLSNGSWRSALHVIQLLLLRVRQRIVRLGDHSPAFPSLRVFIENRRSMFQTQPDQRSAVVSVKDKSLLNDVLQGSHLLAFSGNSESSVAGSTSII